MEKPDEIVFYYARNSRSEGWRYIFLYVVIAILLVIVIRLFLPGLSSQNPVFYALVVGLLILVGVGVVFWFALPAILKNEDFNFIISQEQVSCFSPGGEAGPAFSLHLDDILAVEMYAEAGGSERWHILTRAGERHLITPDYGNPVIEIVRTLIRLRPELEPRRL